MTLRTCKRGGLLHSVGVQGPVAPATALTAGTHGPRRGPCLVNPLCQSESLLVDLSRHVWSKCCHACSLLTTRVHDASPASDDAPWHVLLDRTPLGGPVCRFILVSNHLPIKAKRSADDSGWDFEWDEDALIAEANVRLPSPSLGTHCTGILLHEQWRLVVPDDSPGASAVIMSGVRNMDMQAGPGDCISSCMAT